MATFPFDAIGFDLDGTLIESHRDLGTAVNHALALGGFLHVPIDSATDLIGGGAKVMLKRAIDAQGGLGKEDFRKLYKSMLAYYGENYAVHTRPYPGVLDALDTLADKGVKLAVVTNKFEIFAQGILDTLGIADRFECIVGGDSLGKDADGSYFAKPAAEPVLEAKRRCGGGRFAFVGDSSYDVAAARAAGVPVIAASYGYGDKPDLGADAVIDSFDELIAALESL